MSASRTFATDGRRRCKAAGKPGELLEFKGLDHQLDDSAARTQMLTKIGQLLERTHRSADNEKGRPAKGRPLFADVADAQRE